MSSSSLLEKEEKGFRIFPKAVTSITGRKHADLVPDILRSTGLVKAVKYCTRNNLDPETFTRDLFALENVWFPFMSAILALAPLELEFIVYPNHAQDMRYMPISSSWKDESPLGPVKALFVQPAVERVSLNEGDVVVYWSTMIYRVVTPQALHLLVPGAISNADQSDKLNKVAHVPVPTNWNPSIGQKACALVGSIRRASSRYVAERALTETQAAQFAQTMGFRVFSPEYFQPRLTADERKQTQSVFLNRYDWVDAGLAQTYFSLQGQQLTQYEYAFLTRPYRFFALCLVGWLLVVLGLVWWFYQRLFGRQVSHRRRSSKSSPKSKSKSKSKSPAKKTVPKSPPKKRRPSAKPIYVPVPVPVNAAPTPAPVPVKPTPAPVPVPVNAAAPAPVRRRRKSPSKTQVVIQIRK